MSAFPHRPWRAMRRPVSVAGRQVPRRAVRSGPRRLPRGIGLTLALIVSLGLWALLAYAVTRLFELL